MSDRAAVYCRISSDPRDTGLGVERQQEECLALAKARGWTVVRTHVDNDVSAYSGKRRPEYQALMDSVEAGQVDAVVAWHPDRLHRSPVELESFIAAVEKASVRVETVTAGNWDLSTATGRFFARQLGGVARYESEHRGERLRAKLAQNASRGVPHGRATYGWRKDYTPSGERLDVIAEDEAAVVRRIAEQVIGGTSMREITRQLNDEGVRSPRGGEWRKIMVRHLVLRERNAGLRVHHGEVVGEGTWPAILTTGQLEQVKAVLQDPGRKVTVGSQAKHLLSGIAKCGVCGAPMRVAMNRGINSYRCSAKSCVSRRLVDVDSLVVEVVLGRLGAPGAADLLSPDRSGDRRQSAEQARTLRARLDTAADNYADGLIDARQLERITARIKPDLAAAEKQARTVDDFPLLDGLVGEERAAEVWETLPLTRRRTIIDLLLSITVQRAKQGARHFDPTTVTTEWKQ